MEYTVYKDRLKQLKCAVIIPTYNNEKTIKKVVDSVRDYCDDVIVVNDGSTDHTSAILGEYSGIQYISYKENKGKGYALLTGLRYATEKGFDYAITLDSDGQHFADDIPTFIDKIEKKPGSILIGARNLRADNMPGKNTFANKFSNFWYKIETGNTLQDTQSGFRLYPLKLIEGIHLLTRKYEFEVEIIVRAAWKGINVENVPINVYYPPKEERVSHFRPLRDFTRISILNTFLVIYALLFYYPCKCLKFLTKENIKKVIKEQIINNKESNMRLSMSIGWGIFCGIIPIWGYQMIFAAISAHILKLNKVIALMFSNISIPPMIPFILYGSMKIGYVIYPSDTKISFDNITFESAYTSLFQYIVGSILLAIVSGLVLFILSYLVLAIIRKK